MYQQAAYQNGFSHGANYSGPPPAKKVKSAPVITRYAPPPGYRPPPPSQPYYRPPGFVQSSYAAYQPPQYGAPQPHQQQWPGYPQPAYPPPHFPSVPGPYQPPPTQYPAPWQNPASAPTVTPPQPWQPSPSDLIQAKRRQNSAPYLHTRTTSIGPLDGNGDPLPPPDPSISDANSLEADFDSECYFLRHPDEVDPALSVGEIEWRAPLPTKLALPATYSEAELEALAPRKARPVEDDSISEYFTRAKRDESLLSVRQTELWEAVKDDIIFRELPVISKHVLSFSELRERYRDRPDPYWNVPPPVRTASQTPQPSRHQTPANEMIVDGPDDDLVKIKSEDSSGQDDILGNLEQALFANSYASQPRERHASRGSIHSRTTSMSSTAGEKITRPKPLAPIRDLAQENILAALGVTGSPKMVYQTPGPAFGAPVPQTNGIANSKGRERTSSVTSHRTASGSEIKLEDPELTPRPKTDNRKRSHGEFENGERRWEAEDATPRQLKQPRVG